MEIDPNDMKALIGILQKLVSQTDNQQTEDDDADRIHSAKPTKIKPKNKLKSNKSQQTQHTNIFTDMPEMNMHKDDIALDKKLQKFPPTPRRRPSVMVDVKCRVCGREETISSKILPESANRYKCNDCSKSGG